MTLEERLKTVKEIEKLVDKQIIYKKRLLELSQSLEKDRNNEEIRSKIKFFEEENERLYEEEKSLISKL